MGNSKRTAVPWPGQGKRHSGKLVAALRSCVCVRFWKSAREFIGVIGLTFLRHPRESAGRESLFISLSFL